MATETDDQPVLLTEGEFVPDDDKSPEIQATSDEPEQQHNEEASEPESAVEAETLALNQVPTTEVLRSETAPDADADADVDSSLHDVERSVLSALSMNPSHLPSGGDGRDDHLTGMEKLEQSEAGYGEDEYIAPPEDPYMRAITYMERHKVMQIFQKLTAEIVYHRPSDPLQHMLGELQKMKRERDTSIDANGNTSMTSPTV